jgi:hypothetical protein
MKPMKWLSGIAVLALVAAASGCGGGASSTTPTQPQSGSVFVNGTDAPLPSVVSFQVDITGMTVSDGVNPPVSVLSGTQTVDFARLNGLHTLLDLNSIPAGTYTSVNVTLANPEIMYQRNQSTNDSSDAADGHNVERYEFPGGDPDAIVGAHHSEQSVDG